MKRFLCVIFIASAALCVGNVFAQTGELIGSIANLNSGANTISLTSSTGLLESYTLTLPSAQAGASTFLCVNNGSMSWKSVTDNRQSGGMNFDTVGAQLTKNGGSYLFDVEYPANTSGPLPGAVLLSEVNNPNPTTAGLTMRVRNRNASASGVQLKGIVVNVSNSGSGTQTGVLAKCNANDDLNTTHYGVLLTGTSGTLCGIGTSTPTENLEVNGNILISGVKGLKITTGTNGTMGTATLVNGTVTVSTTRVTSNSRIFLTTQTPVNVGKLYVSARTVSPSAPSFTITSTSATDGSTVAWWIVEP